jgi:hypothetical protein
MIRAVHGLTAKVRASHAGYVMTGVKNRRLSRLGLMLLVLGLIALTCRPLLPLIWRP